MTKEEEERAAITAVKDTKNVLKKKVNEAAQSLILRDFEHVHAIFNSVLNDNSLRIKYIEMYNMLTNNMEDEIRFPFYQLIIVGLFGLAQIEQQALELKFIERNPTEDEISQIEKVRESLRGFFARHSYALHIPFTIQGEPIDWTQEIVLE